MLSKLQRVVKPKKRSTNMLTPGSLESGHKIQEVHTDRCNNIAIPYTSVKLWRCHIKAETSTTQRLLHYTQKSNLVEEFTDQYIRETKQPLIKRMAQHGRANSSGLHSAVFLQRQETLFLIILLFWIRRTGGLE